MGRTRTRRGAPTRASWPGCTSPTGGSSSRREPWTATCSPGGRWTPCGQTRPPGGASPLFFYGFDDLNALQRDAIETLAGTVGVDVTVSLTYEPGRAALAARAEAVEALRPLAVSVNELPAVDEYYAPETRAALHHLERHLFEPAAGRVDAGERGSAARGRAASGPRPS